MSGPDFFVFASMWTTPDTVATAIGGAGLAAGLISLGWQASTRKSDATRQIARMRLSGRLAEGERLSSEVSAADPSGDFTGLEQRVLAWANETIAELGRQARHEVAFFESSAGMTFYATQYQERDRLRNYMIGRLARLGEILGRV